MQLSTESYNSMGSDFIFIPYVPHDKEIQFINTQSRAMGGDKLVSGKFDLFVNAASHQEGTDSQQKGDDSKWVRPLFPRGFWLALIVAAGFGWLIGGVIYK
jgi:hypothetical protein